MAAESLCDMSTLYRKPHAVGLAGECAVAQDSIRVSPLCTARCAELMCNVIFFCMCHVCEARKGMAPVPLSGNSESNPGECIWYDHDFFFRVFSAGL